MTGARGEIPRAYSGFATSHFVPVLNNVRYASDSDHSRYKSELTLWAIKRHMQCSENHSYSITSLASASILSGTVEAERFRGLEVDHQLDTWLEPAPAGGRLLILEDAVDIASARGGTDRRDLAHRRSGHRRRALAGFRPRFTAALRHGIGTGWWIEDRWWRRWRGRHIPRLRLCITPSTPPSITPSTPSTVPRGEVTSPTVPRGEVTSPVNEEPPSTTARPERGAKTRSVHHHRGRSTPVTYRCGHLGCVRTYAWAFPCQ